MASLPDTQRRQLERTVIAARDAAEAGARAALERLAVGRPKPFAEMSSAEQELRAQLRAHARQLGDPRKESGEQEIEHLVAECAYETWHRMLFARFLAENRLLVHPDHGVPVTLPECEELAAEVGEEDGWALASRFAARMLPAIFRPDDLVLRLRLAPEHQQPLEKCLSELAAEIFTADDSLGWVYQFWQTKRKDEVNASGKKIGADELPAVTQLFTEPYMVKFLLHNTLGAWWAGKVLAARHELAQRAASEDELRDACALPGYAWTYLRFIREGEGGLWRPAAGAFEGWPERAAITVLDPCCGSGHFLVEAFSILVPLRMVEEGLSAREACAAVLHDNLFALEIDERCTQIAAFNLALAAWSYPGAGGYRLLPELHIACSGLSVGAKEDEWLKLAGNDERLREGMRRLHRLFNDAPTLGSLIDPRREEAELFKAGFDQLQPLLVQALDREQVKRDAQATEAGIAAQGMAKAAALLARSYTLVITNVPYLASGRHGDSLREFAERHYPQSKRDLATIFIDRCFELARRGGTAAFVILQSWLYLPTHKKLRESLLTQVAWHLVARLGPSAFETIGGEVVNVCLFVGTAERPTTSNGNAIAALDVSKMAKPQMKVRALRDDPVRAVRQAAQLANPDCRFVDSSGDARHLLIEFADGLKGLSTGDLGRFIHVYWEQPWRHEGWVPMQGSATVTGPYMGRHLALKWDNGSGPMVQSDACYVKGQKAWGKLGISVGQTTLKATLYSGEKFDENAAVILPNRQQDLPNIWTFCSSDEFAEAIRLVDRALKVTNKTLVKVPYDPEHWASRAAEKYPNGLPEPESEDPTQWLFHGRPETSTEPLQVAVARLLGYRWPAELDHQMPLSRRARESAQRSEALLKLAAVDGVVCIPPVGGEQPAADRLEGLLASAFGSPWTFATMSALLGQIGFRDKTVEDWLHDGFFEQHCQLFHQRPFVWQFWDGRRRDGFAALVNYHKLDRKLLERLTYAVLGDWIARQRQGAKAGERGAEDRLAAAEALQQKLALILEGEPPHDIFVRWKAIEQQPIGWEPDLNDGVRMNIRPFVEAGVLRKNPRINWSKDRGAEPESLRPRGQFPWFWKDGQFTGERVNDVHLTNAAKRAARAAGGKPC